MKFKKGDKITYVECTCGTYSNDFEAEFIEYTHSGKMFIKITKGWWSNGKIETVGKTLSSMTPNRNKFKLIINTLYQIY